MCREYILIKKIQRYSRRMRLKRRMAYSKIRGKKFTVAGNYK